MKPIDHKIYLASKSPRRRDLLRQIGIEFELLLFRDQLSRGSDVNEDVLADENAEEYVARIARAKADHGAGVILWRRLPPRVVLAADTTVAVNGRILGKPADFKEAVDMMRSLSGTTHEVLTSVAVKRDETLWQATHISEVTFSPLTEDMIQAYCETSEPYDKAGGYGIQGMAAIFIEKILGSQSGIAGLPLYETAKLLRQAGIRIL